MAERVVERLELVEIDEQDRQAATLVASPGELLVEPFVQVAVVVQAGQAVGDGLELGTAVPQGSRLQHRRQALREVAAQLLPAVGLDRRLVDRQRADDRSAGIADGDAAAEPDAVAVGAEHVGLEAGAGQHGGQLVVVEPAVADV